MKTCSLQNQKKLRMDQALCSEPYREKLTCPKCVKQYDRESGNNAWKRHIKTCRRDLMAGLQPEVRAVVGRWHTFERAHKEFPEDPIGWQVKTTVLLKPDGMYTYHEVRLVCTILSFVF